MEHDLRHRTRILTLVADHYLAQARKDIRRAGTLIETSRKKLAQTAHKQSRPSS